MTGAEIGMLTRDEARRIAVNGFGPGNERLIC